MEPGCTQGQPMGRPVRVTQTTRDDTDSNTKTWTQSQTAEVKRTPKPKEKEPYLCALLGLLGLLVLEHSPRGKGTFYFHTLRCTAPPPHRRSAPPHQLNARRAGDRLPRLGVAKSASLQTIDTCAARWYAACGREHNQAWNRIWRGVWCGVAWCGVAWRVSRAVLICDGISRCGVACRDVVWCGVACCGVA